MHQLGSVLEVFEEHKIYLVSQAANDLNLTFVVDADQADRLVQKLHGEIFGPSVEDNILGPTWKELFETDRKSAFDSPSSWWISRRDDLINLANSSGPLYVYDRQTIKNRIDDLSALNAVDRVFYSIKANSNPEILRQVERSGFGFECVSIDEVNHVFNTFKDISSERILFTPNFAPKSEYEEAFKKNIYVTLDNLHPLMQWPELFKGRSIFVRMDPGHGKGHHKYVHTAGTKSKFGVPSTQIELLEKLVRDADAKVIGLHAHVGSNIFHPDTWSEAAIYLFKVAEKFTDVRFIDMGGGLGVAEKPSQSPLNLGAVNDCLEKVKAAYPQYELWLEPGRFVVAESGVLLARVTQTKTKGDYYYVGINTGMNSLIRPALYGSYHEIVNLSRFGEKNTKVANIVGPICESGDVLGQAMLIPESFEGDVVLIATVGAYGRVMSSFYNMRKPAEEVLLD
jgi:diaminopimelate decarboxylase/aspartate kinase